MSDSIDHVDVLEMNCGGLVPKRDNYHPPLDIYFERNHQLTQQNSVKSSPCNVDVQKDWNFAKANFELMYKRISETSWQEIVGACNVNEAVDCFYNSIYSIYDECVPKKFRSSKPTRRYPVWYTADLIKSLKQKAELHRQWKATRNNEIYLQFSRLRSQVKKSMSITYKYYLNRIQRKLNRHPAAFWQHVNSLKSRGGFVPKASYNGVEYEGSNAAQAFSNYFDSVFLPDAPLLDCRKLLESQNYTANLVDIREITSKDFDTGITNLKPNSAIGPDNIPAYIIKGCKVFLKSPLLHIFNLALNSGTYPKRWKISRVQPIPKTNDHTLVENYRPIKL
ncbi:hypothetical protein HF086_002643 [Spodoptera exigua]|uniref:Reverse transcriptase n=1 Tax=Spodoptera exigua TaxID=7107 RepID=A0A922M8V3_SPOEX|nr:hypothetical protein HF086_002643 [Spodoptera exigua]